LVIVKRFSETILFYWSKKYFNSLLLNFLAILTTDQHWNNPALNVKILTESSAATANAKNEKSEIFTKFRL
jgi:hypothetical protein